MSGHQHGDGPALPAEQRRRARWAFTAVLVPVLVVTVLGGWLLWPTGERPTLQTTQPGTTFATVTVTAVDPAATDPSQQVHVRLSDGDAATVQVPPEYLDVLEPGDRLRVVHIPEAAVGGGTPYVFADLVRGPPLAVLAIVFAVLVVAVARWRGLAALVGLGVALAVVGGFTLPALLAGRAAVPVALVSASAIMFVVLYLAHGLTVRTSTALVGTLVGLVATAAIAAWASGAAHLTGLTGEYALDLRDVAPDVSLPDVLLCGMVLAGLGVLNDVTITQASAVWELHAADPAASWRQLFSRGMRIGRDHIASTVYTIVFAYLGASLPLILLVSVSDRSLLDSLTSGEIAEEVARTLVGSVGLVLAIPFTTAVAATAVRSVAGRAPAARPDDEAALDRLA